MFRKLMLLLMAAALVLLAWSQLAYAAKPEDTTSGVVPTSRGLYDTPSPALTEWLNTNDSFSHTHNIYIPERRNPLGVGLDVVVFKSPSILEEVTVQSKYDFQNDEMSGYLVGKLDLFGAVTNFLK